MKKRLLVAVCTLLLASSYAQPGKGRQMIGGSFNVNQSSNRSKDTSAMPLTQKNEASNFTGSVRYGYFITDHILVGVLGSYSQNSSSNENPYLNSGTFYTNKSSQNSNSYSAGLFSRYYKILGKSKFAVFGQLSFTYGTSKSIYKSSQPNNVGYESQETKTKSATYGANFSPGISYFVNKNLSFETTFGNIGFNAQSSTSYESGNKVRSSEGSNLSSNLNLGLSNVFVGVNFYFGGNSPKAPATN